MHLGFITFIVKDIDKSIEFYEQVAGLHVTRRFNPGIGEIAFMENSEGETMLEFIQMGDPEAPTVSIVGMGMSFTAEEQLEQVHERLCSLGYEPGEIYDKGPEPKNFKLYDPDGTVVEIAQMG